MILEQIFGVTYNLPNTAARLRRIVGPPSPRHVGAEPSGQSERSRITTYHWG